MTKPLSLILLSSLFYSLFSTSSLATQDWLINGQPFTTRLVEKDKDLLFTNGIVTRQFRLKPNLCTTAIFTSSLAGNSNSQNLLRAVRPEALITIDGKDYAVGGLLGQPNHAFLKASWLEDMKPDPNGFTFTEYKISEPTARIPLWTPSFP